MERMESGRPEGSPKSIDSLRALIDRTRPVATAEKKILPVLPVFEDLLVDRGLRRGTTVGVDGHAGATSLALAVTAGATRSGSWLACIDLPDMGWAAAAEIGVDMDRVAVVRSSGAGFLAATAALVDAFDLVLCGASTPVTPSVARKLAARARERGSVLVLLGPRAGVGGVGAPRRGWPEMPDVALSVVDSEWAGVGTGSGRLNRRRMTVEVGGRRGSNRARRVELLLPGPDGALAHLDRTEHRDVVVPLRRAG